jgi:L-rhamnonate dehydratase
MTLKSTFPRIKEVRTFIIDGVGSGGDYHNVKGGHWLVDSDISTPMTKWAQYRGSRTSWGINVLGSFCVEIEASDGTKGFATGFGGPPACWLVHQHFERFLVGAGKLLCFRPKEISYRLFNKQVMEEADLMSKQ